MLQNLLLFTASTQAVKLSTSSPSAEQALVQMEEAANNGNCMCFQYAGSATQDLTVAVGVFSITDGGALNLAVNGKCETRIYAGVKVDTGTTPNTVVYPGDPAWGDATDTDSSLDDYYHLNVPVINEACVYNLWMCACWAN